jgi:hypothetical protein
MWTDPYLETCCRSALHRVMLAGTAGRPQGLKDGPCLARLATRGLVCEREDGRFVLTARGSQRHAAAVVTRPSKRMTHTMR